MAIPKPDPGFEDAPGRYDGAGNLIDPWIGVSINNVRKSKTTELGPSFVFPAIPRTAGDFSWWYFLREPHPESEHTRDEAHGVAGPGLYWYRKRRQPPEPGEKAGKVVEEHVGKDKDLPFIIPVQFLR